MIDIALARLILGELERRHIAGYLRHPPDQDDAAWAEVERDQSGIRDDVDWADLVRRLPTPMSEPVPRHGEVWLADLPGGKIRPVVVRTRGSVIRYLHSVVAAPVTSTVRGIPSEVVLSAAEGLLHPCAASFDNLQLLSRSRLIRRVGVPSGATLADACRALRFDLGC